jgi:hypothetical protein
VGEEREPCGGALSRPSASTSPSGASPEDPFHARSHRLSSPSIPSGWLRRLTDVGLNDASLLTLLARREPTPIRGRHWIPDLSRAVGSNRRLPKGLIADLKERLARWNRGREKGLIPTGHSRWPTAVLRWARVAEGDELMRLTHADLGDYLTVAERSHACASES